MSDESGKGDASRGTGRSRGDARRAKHECWGNALAPLGGLGVRHVPRACPIRTKRCAGAVDEWCEWASSWHLNGKRLFVVFFRVAVWRFGQRNVAAR